MPTTEIKEIIPASSVEVFDLLHNYKRRLEWDTLLQKAYLEKEFPEACKGAISVCQGRNILGGFALRTEYVSFEIGKVAAVNYSTSRLFLICLPLRFVIRILGRINPRSFIKLILQQNQNF